MKYIIHTYNQSIYSLVFLTGVNLIPHLCTIIIFNFSIDTLRFIAQGTEKLERSVDTRALLSQQILRRKLTL